MLDRQRPGKQLCCKKATGPSLQDAWRLQVLRCLRMDRVTVAITRYVIAKMGEKYVQPPTLDYSAIYRQSTQMTPIIFVLSPGADPAFDVFKLGKSTPTSRNLQNPTLCF